MKQSCSVLVSTGNLGDTPIEEGTFFEGIKRPLDFLAADAGSADIGPTFLATDTAHNPVEWERHDLALMLVAARERKIPMIVGSCGSTGTDRGVELFFDIISEVARERKLERFRVAKIYSELDKALLARRTELGAVEKLGAPQDLTAADLDATAHVTASMGVEQLIHALEKGADVVIAGRSCDDALFAALPILRGFPRGIALHMGKAIECASLVCFPQKVKESVVGTVTHDAFTLEPIHPDQRATPHSVAAHSMYERVDPYTQAVPGGILDMHETVYEARTERICRVAGSRFIPSPDGTYKVKLEGAGIVGERVFNIVGIRDAIAIRHIDKIRRDVRDKVAEIFPSKREGVDYHIYFHTYGDDGVMGDMEPVREIRSHELGIVIEVVSSDLALATAIAKLAKFRFYYAQYPGQRNSSGGGTAMLVDEPLFPSNPACRWTIDHLLALDDPLDPDLFRFEFTEAGC